MILLEQYEKSQVKKNIPDFRPGDTVKVHTKIREGDKERIQVFEGVVIKKRGSLNRSSFTVRKTSYGVGVERVFPLYCNTVERIEVKQKGKVRRAKLYYLRGLAGRAARISEKKEWLTEREEALAEVYGGKPAVTVEEKPKKEEKSPKSKKTPKENKK